MRSLVDDLYLHSMLCCAREESRCESQDLVIFVLTDRQTDRTDCFIPVHARGVMKGWKSLTLQIQYLQTRMVEHQLVVAYHQLLPSFFSLQLPLLPLQPFDKLQFLHKKNFMLKHADKGIQESRAVVLIITSSYIIYYVAERYTCISPVHVHDSRMQGMYQ